MRKKSKAAAALANLRWSRKTKEERQEWGKWLTLRRLEKRAKEKSEGADK